MRWDDSIVIQDTKNPYIFNRKFTDIKNILNGGIDTDNISASSGISLTKTTLDRVVAVFKPTTALMNVRNVYIGVTATPAPQTITIVTAAIIPGSFWIVKDESGGAAGNNITINFQGNVAVDGGVAAVINTNYGVYRLYAISKQRVVII